MTEHFLFNAGKSLNPNSGPKVVKRTNNTFSYTIVDSEGEPIDLRLVKLNTDIPLTVKSASIEQDGYRLHLTFEYIHQEKES